MVKISGGFLLLKVYNTNNEIYVVYLYNRQK